MSEETRVFTVSGKSREDILSSTRMYVHTKAVPEGEHKILRSYKLPDKLVQQLDEYAFHHHKDKSDVIAEALRGFLGIAEIERQREEKRHEIAERIAELQSKPCPICNKSIDHHEPIPEDIDEFAEPSFIFSFKYKAYCHTACLNSEASP